MVWKQQGMGHQEPDSVYSKEQGTRQQLPKTIPWIENNRERLKGYRIGYNAKNKERTSLAKPKKDRISRVLGSGTKDLRNWKRV